MPFFQIGSQFCTDIFNHDTICMGKIFCSKELQHDLNDKMKSTLSFIMGTLMLLFVLS